MIPVLHHGLHMPLDGVVLAYVGPDQILPLTSFFGAVVGVLLMFWNRVVGLYVRVRRLWSRR
jgi:hypothetical protein